MAILVDLSQVLQASVHISASLGEEITESMLRHLLLNSLLGIKRKFSSKYGQIVLCCDSRANWRRDVFPYYKQRRRESRAESPLDWDAIHQMFENLKAEAKEFYPYKVVEVEKCEGDDIIGQLCWYFQGNEMEGEELLSEPQKVLIFSSDHDFKQLQVYTNVEQYSPMHEKFLREAEPEAFLHEQIIRGDSGDGVPNILSEDDCFVSRTRQKQIRSKFLNECMEDFPYSVPDEHSKNLERNETLISLLKAPPNDLSKKIIQAYLDAPVTRKIPLEYFVKHKLKNLAPNQQDF